MVPDAHFPSSLNRRFVASDSNEYRWTKKAIPGQEWTVSRHQSFIPMDAHPDKCLRSALTPIIKWLPITISKIPKKLLFAHPEIAW